MSEEKARRYNTAEALSLVAEPVKNRGRILKSCRHEGAAFELRIPVPKQRHNKSISRHFENQQTKKKESVLLGFFFYPSSVVSKICKSYLHMSFSNLNLMVIFIEFPRSAHSVHLIFVAQTVV